MNENGVKVLDHGILLSTIHRLEGELTSTRMAIEVILSIIRMCQPVENVEDGKLKSITVNSRLLDCIESAESNNKELTYIIDILKEQFGDELKLV